MYLSSNVLIYVFLMLFACIINNILPIVLPSLLISPLLIARIVTIVLFYATALSLSVVYIQSNIIGLNFIFLLTRTAYA
jgi:hypothetical protein